MASDKLSGREKAAVLWAEHVTLNTARSRDDIFENICQFFNESEKMMNDIDKEIAIFEAD